MGLIHLEQLLRSLDTFYPRLIVSRSRESAFILAAMESYVEFDEFVGYQDLWFGDSVWAMTRAIIDRWGVNRVMVAIGQ